LTCWVAMVAELAAATVEILAAVAVAAVVSQMD
jgi:hypothetical protein